MVGLKFNSEDRVVLFHYRPEETEVDFDMLIEEVPPRDREKTHLKSNLYRDKENNLEWHYIEEGD